MPKIVTLFMSLLLCSCAKPWPAAVTFHGLSPAERGAVESALGHINQQAGKEVVRLTEDEKQFPVHFKMEALGGGDHGEQVGGEAEVGLRSCTIALSPKIMRKASFETVIWHELGHCGGLEHVGEVGEVMSPEAEAFRNYPAARLDRFVQALRQSTGLISALDQ